MQCIHKRFCVLGTVFLFIFANFLVVSAAQAQNSLFTVENVTVDITSKSAVAAREEAFEKAQVDAFTILAVRLLATENVDPSRIPHVDTISSMIKDYEISNEQLSTVRYLATYKFRFNENAVRNFFQVSGAVPSYNAGNAGNVGMNPGAMGAAAPMANTNPPLILPFYQYNGRTVLWSPYNMFLKAWARAENLDGLQPLSVPLGDIADVSDIGDEEALDYNNAKLTRMLERYEASEAIILIAVPDENLARAQAENDAASGSMLIQIYRTDRGFAEQVNGVEVNASGNDTLRNVMDKAVRLTQNAVRGDWKQNAGASASEAQGNANLPYGQQAMSGDMLRIRVPYASLKEWADTRRALSRTYGVRSVSVVSMTSSEAFVDIQYDGNINRLSLSMGQNDLQLNQTSGGQSMAQQANTNDSMTYYAQRNARANNAAGNNNGAAYEVYLRRNRR